MRNNYNSFEYWEELIDKNKTMRGHMFMDKLPTEKSTFMHTLVFSADNGLVSVWSYFPDERLLLGYIQYCFLQEAFYKWIYGKNKIITDVPNIPVEKIIADAEKEKSITKEEAKLMRSQLDEIKKMWALPKSRLLMEIKKFERKFNKSWYGDQTEFIYMKIFKTPQELGEFVINSTYMVGSEEVFKERTGLSIDEWRDVCTIATKDMKKGEIFREKLLREFTEVI